MFNSFLIPYSKVDTLVVDDNLTFLIEKENDIPINQQDDYYFVRFSESIKIKVINSGKLRGKVNLAGSGVSLSNSDNNWYVARVNSQTQFFYISVVINNISRGKWKFRKY